jgi:hypothetical protein
MDRRFFLSLASGGFGEGQRLLVATGAGRTRPARRTAARRAGLTRIRLGVLTRLALLARLALLLLLVSVFSLRLILILLLGILILLTHVTLAFFSSRG